jgi:hypothetical protein
MREVRCIDCKALDVGFNPDADMWIHCGVKHSQDIAKALQQGTITHAQERMTKDKAMAVHDCQYFDKNDQKQAYEELLRTEKMIRENPRLVREEIKFLKELFKLLRRKGGNVETV